MREDDPIEDLFRRTDPARTALGAPLTAEQIEIRERITRAAPRRRAARWLPAVAIPLAAAVTVVALFAGNIFSAAPAAAYGPRPLAIQELGDRSTQDAIAHAIAALEAAPASTDVRSRTADHWALEIAESGTPQESVTIQASVLTLDWAADGSGERRLTAGIPFYADGSPGEPEHESGPAPGELIWSAIYKAGEFTPSIADLTVLDAPAADALPVFGLTTESGAGDLAALLSAVLSEWRPSAAHEARLLTLLGELDGFMLAGTTTDRLGRPALAFTATTPQHPARSWTVLVSPDTGRILGLDEQTVGADPTIDVPPGTVVQYIAWH